MNILSFLWHLSGKQVLVSGGLRRFIEVVSRGEKHKASFAVIENSPPLRNFNSGLNYEVLEFPLPFDRHEDALIIRLLMWSYYALRGTITGVMLARKREFDIVMTHSGELFCTAIPAFMTHLLRRVPLVYVVQLAPPGLPSHGIVPEYQRYRHEGFPRSRAVALSLYAFIGRVALVKLYNRAQLVITVSESLKTQLRQYGVTSKMHVIQNGLNLEEMKAITHDVPEKYDAIFVGRHTPEKGVFDLIEVWRHVAERIPTAVLALVGYCTRDVKQLIERRIKQYKLRENIVMKGVLPRNELIASLKQAKLFLFLSREESFALAIGEALACGLPVICYNIPPVQEFYQTDAVFQCCQGDTACVTEKTMRLLKDGQARKKLRIRAHLYVQKFNWDETAKEELKLINRLLA